MRDPLPSLLCAAILGCCLSAQETIHRWNHPIANAPAAGDVNGDGKFDYAIPVLDDGSGQRAVFVYDGHRLGGPPAFRYTNFGPSPYAETVTLADLDNDGRDEIVLGIPGDSSETGIVRAYSGRFPSVVLFSRTGDRPGALYGNGLECRDLDGDGTVEVLVAASGFCDQSGYFEVLNRDGTLRWSVRGPGTCSYFGAEFDVVGDVDGDGHEDLLVGANEHSIAGTGFAWLLSGRDGTQMQEFRGAASRDHYGTGIAGVGDQDGDGVPDFAIGASQHENGAIGYVELFSGGSAPRLVANQLTGTVANGYFGDLLTGLGDLDGDGVEDFAVSASEAPGGGRVYIYSSMGMRLLHTLAPATGTSGFGGVVAVAERSVESTRVLVASVGLVELVEFRPGFAVSVGAGCHSMGSVPSLAVSTPRSGGPYAVSVTNVTNGAPVLLGFGNGQAWGSTPLPVALGGIGMPGCTLYTSADVLEPLGFAAQQAVSTQFGVPSVLGLEFYLQALVLDPGANAAGISLSDAWRIKT